MVNPRNYGISILTCIMAAILFSGCEKQVTTQSDIDWVHTTLGSMDASTRMGQSFCLTVDPVKYFIYPDYRATTDQLIETYQFGAIYLATDLDSLKMETREEFNGTKLRDVISQMQRNALVPMVFTADFENGAWYWDTKATQFPNPLALAAAGSPVMSYRQAKITAVEAQSQGLHMVFTPLLNIDINASSVVHKLTSFGENAELAAVLGSQYVSGCQESGIAACARHFPTEPGDTSAELAPEIVEPFRAAIEQGVIAMQCAPIAAGQFHIDPATDSAREQRYHYLRQQLGFRGLVISKFMCAPAATMNENLDDALVAFALGNDMLILPETDVNFIPLLDVLHNRIVSKDMDVSAFSATTSRLIETKDRLGIQATSESFSAGNVGSIGLPEYSRTASEIADVSVTVLRNEGNILPLDLSSSVLSLVFLDPTSPLFATQYEEHLEYVTENTRTINIFGVPDDRIVYEILRRTRESDSVICSFLLKPNENYSKQAISSLMTKIIRANRNVVIVSYYDPYLITRLPVTSGYINAYSPASASMQATIEVMFGLKPAHGQLPIHISDEFFLGAGLAIGNGTVMQ